MSDRCKNAMKLESQALALQPGALDSGLMSDRRNNLFCVSHELPRLGDYRVDPNFELVIGERLAHGTHLTGFGEMAA
jgi:hypothetical protein